ncbi:hypothetical protein ACFYWP_37225 [Actinacidiphila glaucinigra]|uniref:hypothetical protein n=1 Tax=Actinacidiphila glaucinigra TaxID=235986 RepID=UPI0036A8E1B4
MAITIKVVWMRCKGEPTGCPECGASHIEFSTSQPFDTWPSWGWCITCGHSWEDTVISTSVVRAIRSGSTGRRKATDSDLFAVKLPNGWLLEGELLPEITIDDVRQIGKIYWRRIVKPAARKKKRQLKRAVKKGATKAVKGALAGPAALALRADWETRAGGWEPPVIENPCPAGCDRGSYDLDTNIHEDSPRVTCSFCHGTGVDPTA